MQTVRTKRRRVIVIGFPSLAKTIPSLLSGDGWTFDHYTERALLHVPAASAVYQVGGGPVIPPRIYAAARLLGRAIVKHWVGTDVLHAADPAVATQNQSGYVVHWADCGWLVDELREHGISANEVPFASVDPVEPAPFPGGPLTVLTYLPDRAWEFYGGDDVIALARRFPAMRFLVVAGEGVERQRPPNVEYLGQVDDMQSVYARSHVLLRMPDHDGMSRMVVEALAHARYAIWNHPYPGTHYAGDADHAAAVLADMQTRLAVGALKPNAEGREHVVGRYEKPVIRERIHSALEEALHMVRQGGMTRA